MSKTNQTKKTILKEPTLEAIVDYIKEKKGNEHMKANRQLF